MCCFDFVGGVECGVGVCDGCVGVVGCEWIGGVFGVGVVVWYGVVVVVCCDGVGGVDCF